MDDLGRPWPCLESEGSTLVPTPQIDSFGNACWRVEGRFSCPVGYLLSSLSIFGILT